MNDKLEKENKELKDLIKSFEEIDLTFINSQGRVKMIKWGKDYNKWNLEKRLEYAEALASAMNDACRIIQNERNEWLGKALALEKSLAEAQQQADNHMKNNIQAITQANTAKQEMAKTIRRLENELLASHKKNDELTKDLHIATLNTT